MASSCASEVKPGRFSIPCEPISSVMRVLLYPALSVADTCSLYFTFFLSLDNKADSSSAVSGCSVKGRWPPC